MEHGSSECVMNELGALGWSRISRCPSKPEDRRWVREADAANTIDTIRAHPAHHFARQLKLVHHAHVLSKHALTDRVIFFSGARARAPPLPLATILQNRPTIVTPTTAPAAPRRLDLSLE